MVIGFVGRDPEVRYSANGAAVLSLSVASTRKWKNKDTGEVQEETEWHRIVAYEKLAEIISKYAKKGSAVYIEGRLKTRKWKDNSGVEKYSTEIVAEVFQSLGEKQEENRPASGQSKSRAQAKTGFDDMDDDIPF